MRRVVNLDQALEASSRREILTGILERAGVDVNGMLSAIPQEHLHVPQGAPALRVAGS
jgi:hypothetical protein